jgi:hypothetical protein
MAAVSDITSQLSTLQSAITTVGTKVDALIAAGATGTPVATQADLDTISAGLASAQAALDAINAK